MCVINLIEFTDKYQGHVRTLYTIWFFITFKLYQIHKYKDYIVSQNHFFEEILVSLRTKLVQG